MKNSVCIATYNGERFIQEQIASILPQLQNDDELIISDDYSTDRTIEIIESFREDRIKIIFNKTEKGYTNNFENAIKHASGDFIYLSDQDDVWLPHKIEVFSHEFEHHDFLVSNAKIVNEELESLDSQTYFDLRGMSTGFLSDLIKTKSLGCCMAFNKKVLQRILPFPPDKKLCPHDFWILLISEFYYRSKVIKEPLVLYRRHGNTTSTGGAKSSSSLSFMIKFRLYCLVHVLKRY
ncbi:glycosyltransferase [Kaistella polysaccharea]|uniref:glycosyltransferase n=1 Tax=Kaistella polysaccharea TaxID=2878534 RepID=UPI001CF5B7FA|nr:glycosyltransferase [Kaistella polysaccharea]